MCTENDRIGRRRARGCAGTIWRLSCGVRGIPAPGTDVAPPPPGINARADVPRATALTRGLLHICARCCVLLIGLSLPRTSTAPPAPGAGASCGSRDTFQHELRAGRRLG